MTTLTLDHPGKETSELLHTCDQEGSIRIVTAGRQYVLRSSGGDRGRIGVAPDFESRLSSVFPQTIPPTQTAEADRLLSGE